MHDAIKVLNFDIDTFNKALLQLSFIVSKDNFRIDGFNNGFHTSS